MSAWPLAFCSTSCCNQLLWQLPPSGRHQSQEDISHCRQLLQQLLPRMSLSSKRGLSHCSQPQQLIKQDMKKSAAQLGVDGGNPSQTIP